MLSEKKSFEQVGDPMADAAIAEILEARRNPRPGRSPQEFYTWASILANENPGPNRALLEWSREWVNGFNQDDFNAGARLYNRAQPYTLIALGLGSFNMTFMVPSIARLLLFTRRTELDVRNRLYETLSFTQSVVNEGLAPGGAGYRSAINVRLLHAMVRYAATEAGFREKNGTVPINQLEMVYLNTLFVSYVVRSLEQLGIRPTTEEKTSYALLWNCANGLVGTNPELLAPDYLTDDAWLSEFIAGYAIPDESSTRLVLAFIDSFDLKPPLFLPKAVFEPLMREILGDHFADGTGIAQNPMPPGLREVVVPAVASALRLVVYATFHPIGLAAELLPGAAEVAAGRGLQLADNILQALLKTKPFEYKRETATAE